MIVRETPWLVVADSICFALMYRCLECGQVVRGKNLDDDRAACEQCGASLDENDEIAQRLDDDE